MIKSIEIASKKIGRGPSISGESRNVGKVRTGNFLYISCRYVNGLAFVSKVYDMIQAMCQLYILEKS